MFTPLCNLQSSVMFTLFLVFMSSAFLAIKTAMFNLIPLCVYINLW